MRGRMGWWACAVTLAALAGCDENGIGTLGADNGPAASNSASSVEPRVKLTSDGVAPSELSIPSGSSFVIMNNDSAPHQFASNPHPQRTDCPELNAPMLSGGQSFSATVTGPARDCGFHDHLDPSDTRFQGVIHITAPTPSGGSGTDGGATTGGD